MSAKAAKVQEQQNLTAKNAPAIWKNLQGQLAKGAKLLTARLTENKGLYEITFNDVRLGLCRTLTTVRQQRV